MSFVGISVSGWKLFGYYPVLKCKVPRNPGNTIGVPSMRGLILVTSLLFASPAFAQQMDVHDGTWWNQLETANDKALVLLGFVEGMRLGREFATLDGINGNDIKMWVKESDDSFVRNYNAMIAKTSGLQILDGLDSFYKDFRNRSIHLPFAVLVVGKQIAGTPQADIDRLVEGYRKGVRQ